MKNHFSALTTIFFMTDHARESFGGSASQSSEATSPVLDYPKTIVREFQADDRIPTHSHYQEESTDHKTIYAGDLTLIGVRQMTDSWLATYSGQLYSAQAY